MLGEPDLNVAYNRTTVSKHLWGKGLNLKLYGNARTAMKCKAIIRKLWRNYGKLENPGYHSDYAFANATKHRCLPL